MDKARCFPKPDTTINLSNFDANFHEGYTEEEADALADDLRDRLEDLQEVLYAEEKQSLLVVFQAMDAGGKDSSIRKAFTGVNPQGVRVANFKAPTPVELDHDFLWRVHQEAPRKGYIGVFNRSHYEDVLIVRVDNLAPQSVWEKRYDHINNFERLLADSSTRILKFYLHIDKDEQKKRFQKRLDNPSKHWKFAIGDLRKREQWDEYMAAYEDAITRCNTDYAPWFIVPANHKWYRDLFILRVLVETLEDMNPQYPPEEDGLEDVVIPD